MSNYTPGPWFVHDFTEANDGAPSDITISCTTPDHITVANMGLGLTGKREEWEANARLIAAAPELLEALEAAVEALDSDHPDIQLRVAVAVRAAIAKAKGE